MNSQTIKPRIFLSTLLIVVFSIGLAVFLVTPALALYIDDTSGMSQGFGQADPAAAVTPAIKVDAETAKRKIEEADANRKKAEAKTITLKKIWDQLKKAGAIAYKAALKNFLNTLAYDMATYLATGDKGQLPMFETQGWGGYLQNVADNSAGKFIEQLGENSLIKFNLCNPDFRIMLKINLGLTQSRRPKPPKCTFSQMTKNWGEAVKGKNFLPEFQDMFNPWSNDLGIALTLQTGIETQVSKDVNKAIKDREEGAGFKAVLDPISHAIKTPSRTVMEAAGLPIKESTKGQTQFTGEIVADSIDIFLNTLAGKLIIKWLKGGLVNNFPPLTNKLDELVNFSGQNRTEGVEGAKDRLKSIVEPNFRVRADYDILVELASCPDPNKAGPTDCVIDEKFRQAIEKKMTVGEALKEGYLNGNGIFGFTSDGLEPKFNEGYPYRSMIILRKYRIIPVGWEVAAQKIKDLQGLHCSVSGNICTTVADCPNQQCITVVDGTKNLKDLTDCFANTNASQPWCLGLVDPDWVLKSPQNFCKREGAGPEIISEQVTGEGADSTLSVLRDDAYCADEQSVVSEKSDGSPIYGYCTEERRKWDFNAKSCAPLYNTCQTFSSAAGQTNSYLENTLDFSFCNLGNAGCQKYAIAAADSYDSAAKNVDWKKSTEAIHLNKQVESCDTESEGCRGLVRLNSGGGANFLVNSGFEEDLAVGVSPANFFNTTDGDKTVGGYNSSFGLQLNTLDGPLNKSVPVGGVGFTVAGESYALSFYAKGCTAGDNFSLGGVGGATANLAAGADWVKYSLAYTYPTGATASQVYFAINSTSCLIDNIKLERGWQATNYSAYASGSSLIYEKLMPDYLTDACYTDQGNYYAPKDGAPANCSDFARQCKQDEAGCELYVNETGETKIPAKVIREDYCPAACVGYDTFVQGETPFDTQRDAYFIPKTARTCDAVASGCDQFTNLDEEKKGGESIGYYTYLRQCLKKSDSEESCGDFYTWEGSDESGFQLKTESLKLDDTDDVNLPEWARYTGDPAVLSDDSKYCSEAIYNLPPSNPAYKADCRQFYNRLGGISYHLYSSTVSCTEDCHPYRRTALNTDEKITQANCKDGSDSFENCTSAVDKNKCWLGDLATGQCIVCKDGGAWSIEHNACIYMAVPSLGLTCSAQANGCREYTGNTGNNLRNIFTDDFSNGTVGAWAGVSGSVCHEGADTISCVAPSSEAITLGPDNKGHSIKVTIDNATPPVAVAQRPVGNAVRKGLDYVLKFVAKSELGTRPLTVTLGNGADVKQIFSTLDASSINLTTEWRIFEINLTGLNHSPGANEILRLTTPSGNFYINNITLTEITDRYYLIKNSWRTPDACYKDVDLADKGIFYNLGCDKYTDRASKVHNLRHFNKLCSESAVGCELMIDTENSSGPKESYYVDGQLDSARTSCAGAADCVTVPADNFTYAVYDAEKLCGAGEKGCERLGKPYKYETTTLYGDIYLKNNPDKYAQTLCGANAVGCETFAYNNGASSNGEKYFKDPGDMTCEWRKSAGNSSEVWLKKKVKRCDDGVDNIDGVKTVINANAANGKIDAKVNAVSKLLEPNEDNVCLSNADCSIVTGTTLCSKDADCGDFNKCLKASGSQTGSCHYSCLADNNDYACPTDEGNTKTLGLGGIGNRVVQPAGNGWAGICAAADSGCTEYLDPLSKFNTNLVFNGDFQNLATGPTDGWVSDGTCPAGSYCQSVILETNTAYRLGRVASGAGLLTIKDCSAGSLYEIDNNNSLGSAVNLIRVDIAGYANSRIFYYKGASSASCTIEDTIGVKDAAVELKKAVIDYQLAQNLDKQGCNGLVNFSQGCVLFNERKQSGTGLKKLDFDADILDFSNPAAEADKDSSIILKVAPDRVCDKWLSCKSYIKDAKGNNVCFDVGLCDAVDGNGNCQSFISSKKANQLAGNLDISNLSGYSKVGIIGGNLITDYYPFGAMKQEGEVANLSNGGFEYSGANGYPSGWNWGKANSVSADKTWSTGIFSIINNPIAVQAEGIGYAPEGAAFLKLGSSYEAVSEQIDVMPETEYIITAYVNTKNLKNGQAKIDIMEGDYQAGSAGAAIDSIPPQDVGLDWNFKMGKFTTGPTDSQIKVKLYAILDGGALEGNFYFDDIKIRPALNSRTKSPTADLWYTPQSCRLYPQSDSLACDYYEDSGKRQKGWPGYCLEYDRRPGDPNTCLLWYPVDKVKGDGIEEGAGYLGKIPVFYCTEATAEKKYEYRHAYPIMSPSFGNFGACQAGYRNTGEQIACGNWRSGGACNSGAEYVCVPTGKAIALDGSKKSFKEDFDENDDLPIPNVNSPTDGWYDYNGLMAFPFGSLEVVISSANNKYARLICNSAKAQNAAVSVSLGCDDPAKACSCVLTKELYRSTAYCSKVVQTVTSMGQNKYWSSRVYKGSNYSVPNPLAYKYETDAAPFGSMVPPSSNPYDWDSDPVKDGVQPIYYSTDKTRIRSGEGYGCIYSPSNLGNASNCNFLVDDSSNDNFPYTYVRALSPTAPAMDLIKRLFAQSYGIWKWSTAEARTDKCKDSSVAGVNGSLCDLSNNDCIGGACTGSATKNVCSLDNSVNCITKAVEVDECKPAKGLESRCENDPDGDKCCAALQSATAKTNCSVCKKDSKGWYRCGGLNNGNLCCPGGQACYVCKDQTIIPKEGLSDDHCGDLGRAKCTLTEINRDYYSWNGADNYAKRCCNGEANPAPDISKEGTCISTQIKTCIGGESNGEFCAAHDCPGGKCETVTSTLPSRYVNDDSVSNWGPPVQVCKDTNSVTMITRSSVATDYLNSEDYCAIPPFVSNIKVNSIITNVELTKNGFINLTFNTKVDSNQLPMVMYGIDWGDNTKTVVTGVEMRDKPNTNLPESVYHLYSYWDLKAKFNQQCPGLGGSCNYNSFTCQGGTKAGQSCIDCTTSGQCKVKPKIQIKDNWGWCNNSATINGCSTATWESFDHWVVVKEK